MFKIKKLFKAISFILIILTLIISFTTISSGEQSLIITNWIVQSNILENGDLKIKEDTIKKEARGALFGNIAVILSIIEILIFIFFFIKYRRSKDIHEEEKYLEIPDDNTPAVVSYITSTGITSNTITATILDLYRKEYIKIDDGNEFKRGKKTLTDFVITKVKEEDNNLLNHEKYFINWLIKIIGDGSVVTTKDIENYSKTKVSKFTKQYNGWTQLIKEDANSKGYFDKSTRKYSLPLIILFPIGLILSILSLVNENILGLFLIFTSILMLFQGITLLSRRSDYGYYQHKKWTEFKKHMKKIKKDNLQYNLNKYPKDISLIYGLVFGIDNNILSKFNIETSYKKDVFAYGHGWMYWYFIFNSGKSNAFNKSVSNSFSSATSSIGGGGGFTVGGGGGAGGGGAGGF